MVTRVALALQVGRHLLAQLGEDLAQQRPVLHRMQIAVEVRPATHADGLALQHHGAIVATPGGIVQP